MKKSPVFLAVLALSGCGSSSDKSAEEDAARDRQLEEILSEPEPRQKNPMARCLEEAGLEVVRVRDHGDLVVTRLPGTGQLVNVNTFPSAAEAKEFSDQLAVPGDRVGRYVAVYFRQDPDVDAVTAGRTCLRNTPQP